MKKSMKFYTSEELKELNVIKKLPVYSLEKRKAINSFCIRYSRDIKSVGAKLWYMNNRNTPFKRQNVRSKKESVTPVIYKKQSIPSNSISIKIKSFRIVDNNLIINY
mgnify:FL=1|tara:strand:+ start:267 stop:587 length:321 start_codon:yes stop_codon:yes gene_type:complete